jgi:hypothetical protein
MSALRTYQRINPLYSDVEIMEPGGIADQPEERPRPDPEDEAADLMDLLQHSVAMNNDHQVRKFIRSPAPSFNGIIPSFEVLIMLQQQTSWLNDRQRSQSHGHKYFVSRNFMTQKLLVVNLLRLIQFPHWENYNDVLNRFGNREAFR